MLRQIELQVEDDLQAIQSQLRGVEARVGEITDIFADGAGTDRINVAVANNRSDVPVNSLVLVAAGEAAPDGKALQVGGTVWIGEVKTLIAVYR